MVEKRKSIRRHLIYYLRVFDQKQDKLVGHLVDISKIGFMLMSETPLKTDKNYHFNLELPTEVRGVNQISFTAKSVWGKKDINPDYYNTGFQLQTMAPDHLDIIRSLIVRFRFHD